MPLVAAVDIGTASARAGIFDAGGRLLARAEAPLEINHPGDGHAEQSSAQIWQAAAAALKAARTEAAARPEEIAGLSFDATCSLVLRDAAGRPVTVSRTGDDRWDTILWLDHRATAQAEECTASRHRVLDYTGGVMSPEMEIPKLMWLKRHLPASWARLGAAFDLADFLTWAATGNPARSQCTLTCKWTYLAHETPGWAQDFLDAMGLPDLLARAGLPASASPIATDLGPLTPAAAADLGLTPATRVAAGLIDAHAGALGVLGHLAETRGGRAPPRADHRHLLLPDGLLVGPAHDPRRLGPLPRRRPARPLDERRRPVRLRRPPRPPPAPARPRSDACRSTAASSPASPSSAAPTPTSPPVCTSSPISTATARPSPTPRPSASSPASPSTPPSTPSAASTGAPASPSPSACAMSSSA